MRSLLTFLLVGVIAMSVACSSAQPVAAPTAPATAAKATGSAAPTQTPLTPIPMKINIANATAHGAFMVAVDNGYFADAGIKVEPAGQVTSGTDQMQAMLGGSFAYTGASGVSFYAALEQGVPISAVAIYAGGGDRTGLLARKGLTIKAGADLVGKTVGSPSRTIGQEALYAYMLAEGVDPKTVKMVTVSDVDFPAAIASGTIDAGVTTEPYVSAVVNSGTGTLVTRLGKYVGGANNVILFPTQYIKDNPEAVDRFLTAFARGMQYMRQHQQEASVILGKRLKSLAPDALKVSIDYLTWDPRFTADALKSMQTEMDLQIKLGWITKTFDLKVAVDPKPFDNVQKKHPEYFNDLK